MDIKVAKALVEKLHQEVYRLSEAYEQHPEMDANTYELGELFEETVKFLVACGKEL